MPYTFGPFTVDQFDFISSVPNSVLVAVAAERFDLNRLAREELANRGYDQSGVWVGFARAQQALQERECSGRAAAVADARTSNPETAHQLAKDSST